MSLIEGIFEESNLKISRSLRHIDELQAEITSYISRDPYAVLLLLDTNTQKYRIGFLEREKIPGSIRTIFGDAVHNLRTALDLLANDLVSLSGAIPKQVYFPFADSAAGFEVQIKRKMRGANAELITMIRALKPYRGGNEFLRALHDLDISDKHVALIQSRRQ